jgi:enoyl-CoA hydratase/carnithine racemase
MSDAVLIERKGAIALVTLNRSETRNALSADVIEGLVGFLSGANADETLGCIILTGAGQSFSSGGNVKEMRDGTHPMFTGTPIEMQEGYRNGIQQLPRLFHQLDVPAIAAVNGHAIGAGLDLSTMCDIRIASNTATFAESFLRVGLISGDGGAWYLPRVIGQAKAMEMALTCCTLDADQARDWGLVTHVVEPESLLDKAWDLAGQITAFPPKSIRLNKRLMRQSAGVPLETALDLASSFQSIVQNTDDQHEAVVALLERRAPVFKGG